MHVNSMRCENFHETGRGLHCKKSPIQVSPDTKV